ncbi:TPA: acetyl-CoA C-acyltransferase [Enterococcus faecalis]|uniref:thiolase family protein n=1 Tax=Enterococcus faecalis TaxID=1351 RepID=UPI0036D5B135
MESVYIIDATRLPIGKYGGVLAKVSPEELGGSLLKELLQRNNLHNVDEVIIGNVVGGGGNLGRRVTLASGLPVEVPAFTIDRQCASGLESILLASAKIKSGMADCIACGGVESTSRAPWLMERPKRLYGSNPQILARAPLSIESYGDPAMGEACEKLAQKLKISREEQDEYAYQSQKKYQAAQIASVFQNEITPFRTVTEDESPRPNTSREKLAALPPVFQKNGTLTAGNCCPLNDGAAFLLVANANFCRTYQIKPLAEIIDGTSVGILPAEFILGPVYATEKLLQKNQLSIAEIDRIEVNEAFAAQTIACVSVGKWPKERINSSGGALAFGHPFGATGAILVRRLLTELQQKQQLEIGLVTMCVGGGQGTSLLLRKV